jgi:ribosomal protein L35AE/L33A
MMPRRTLLVLVLLVVVVVASVVVYNYVRTQESSLVVEQSINITHFNLNRKASTLVGANVSSQSSSATTFVSAKLVKVQSGIAVASTTFTTPLSLEPGDMVIVPLNFKLDPEGADYTLYIYTSKGTVVKGTISYP